MTEDDIVKMARDSGLAHKEMTAEGNSVSMGRITRFAEMVAAAEREACAKVCEDTKVFDYEGESVYGDAAAEMIRMRSNAEGELK